MLEYAEAEVGTVQMNSSDLDDSHLRLSSASVKANVHPLERTHGSVSEERLKSTGDDDDDVTMKPPKGDRVEASEEARVSLRSMPLLDEGGGGIASVVGGSSSDGDGVVPAIEKRHKEEGQDGGASSASGRESQGKAGVEDHDPEEERISAKSLPEPQNASSEFQKCLGRAVLPSRLPTRTTRSAFRKPLGKLQSTGGGRNGGKAGTSAAASVTGRGTGRGKTEVCHDEEANSDGELEAMEEENSSITKRKRGQKEGRDLENGKRKKMEKTKSREETRRCRATRYVRERVCFFCVSCSLALGALKSYGGMI